MLLGLRRWRSSSSCISAAPLALVVRPGRSQHTLSALPANWRKLSYQQLEVFDTSELKSLQTLLAEERERAVAARTFAKEQQRKVLKVDMDLDLKKIDKINVWVENIFKDSRRTW